MKDFYPSFTHMHSVHQHVPTLSLGSFKNDIECENSPRLNEGTLSPDINLTPPVFTSVNSASPILANAPPASKIDDYVFQPSSDKQKDKLCSAYNTKSCMHCLCKVTTLSDSYMVMAPYLRVGSSNHINQFTECILGKTEAYFFFPENHGDLHSFIRTKKKVKESEASSLFQQILLAVLKCHEEGVILRDVKLRKFVFKNSECTRVMLADLDGVKLLEDDENDAMVDKHGCPAYVSPEILNFKHSYSGKKADMWALGVILFTMLVGRYPFHDKEPSGLFSKIRNGDYTIPPSVSSRAKCLLRNLLHMDPDKRLSAEQALQHPWFNTWSKLNGSLKVDTTNTSCDQIVPEYLPPTTEDFFV